MRFALNTPRYLLNDQQNIWEGTAPGLRLSGALARLLRDETTFILWDTFNL